jgi:hypothetical protein
MAAYKAVNQDTGLDFRFWQVTAAPVAASTAYTNLVGTSGKIHSIFLDNTTGSAAAVAVKFYDTGVAPVNGTTLPSFCVGVPGGAKETFFFPEGLSFSTGVGMALSAMSDGFGTPAGSDLSATFARIVIVFK